MDVEDERVRAIAHEILSRAEYARFRYTQPELPGWLVWLRDQLEAFVHLSRTLYIESPLAYWAILLGMTIVAVGLFAHVIYAVRRALSMASPEAERELPAGYVDLVRRADEAAYEGGFLEAARLLQLACIELMLKRGWIELSRSDTNAVLRRHLSASRLSDEVKSSMRGLIDRLEVHQFRDHAAGQTLYTDWRQLHGQLTELEQPSP